MIGKHNGHQTQHNRDNPVYVLTSHPDSGTLYQNQDGSTTTSTHAGPAATLKYYEKENKLERECANPIYGSEDTNDCVYTTPGGKNDKDQGSLPDHEFENIIYGAEDMNTYSEPTATILTL